MLNRNYFYVYSKLVAGKSGNYMKMKEFEMSELSFHVIPLRASFVQVHQMQIRQLCQGTDSSIPDRLAILRDPGRADNSCSCI